MQPHIWRHKRWARRTKCRCRRSARWMNGAENTIRKSMISCCVSLPSPELEDGEQSTAGACGDWR
uniref:Uncharacterized protein n=1 Tax=Triticum urartu TaxID=4572 RepID=A0A8R7UZP7_TRIUA